MRRTSICVALLLFSAFLLAEDKAKQTSGIDFRPGVGFSFNVIDCKIGDAAIANKLTVPLSLLEIRSGHHGVPDRRGCSSGTTSPT